VEKTMMAVFYFPSPLREGDCGQTNEMWIIGKVNI